LSKGRLVEERVRLLLSHRTLLVCVCVIPLLAGCLRANGCWYRLQLLEE